MAEDKKSFLLYCDLIHTVKKLSNEQAGELFKHILSYVNDENPVIDNFIMDLVFEPIKHQLKRNLIKWEEYRGIQSEKGKLGGAPKGNKNAAKEKTTETTKPLIKTSQTSLSVNASANANVPVSVNVSAIEKDERLKKELGEKMAELENKRIAALAATAERKKIFYSSLIPFSGMYDKSMIRDFYNYWSESNRSGFKIKFELEKTWETNIRLQTWARREKEKINNRDQTKLTTVSVNY